MKNMLWFLLAAAALATAFALKSPYMAYTVYAFLLLVLIGRISSTVWLAGLDCERGVTPLIVQQGEEVHAQVTITNRRGWPIPWIFFEDPYPAHCFKTGENTRLAVLMPGRSVTMTYTLSSPSRGYYRIGPLMMETGDLFGLQKQFRTGKNQDYVSVLPTIAYIDTFNISSRRPQGPIRLSHRIYEDPTRISGLREYEPGDPMNRIHWKASARTGGLYTKTYEASTVTGGTLLLDLHDESYVPEGKAERMELAVTVTASIAYLLQMSSEQVGMMTNGLDAAELARYEVDTQRALSREEIERYLVDEATSDRLSPLHVPTLRSADQAQVIAENLARVVPGYGLDVEQMLLAEFRGLPRNAALLPVVPAVTKGFAMALAEMKLCGFAVSVFLINSDSAYEEARVLLEPHHIHVFHITGPRDLHELSPAAIGH